MSLHLAFSYDGSIPFWILLAVVVLTLAWLLWPAKEPVDTSDYNDRHG